MGRTVLRVSSFLALAAACAQSPAADFFRDFSDAADRGKAAHRLDIDNDTLLMNQDDGFYSSGLRYTRTYSLATDRQLTNFGWRLGQELYTASDIKLAPERVGPNDHPYAGWIYAGLFKETFDADGRAWRYGLDFGCIGPCAGGEWTQKNFHRLIDQPLPRGWSKQIRNEFGAVLHGEYTPGRWMLGSAADAAPSIRGRFGNIFTDAGAGLLLRAGRLSALPHQDALHGYLRAEANLVAYNATLQGGYFSGSQPHTVKPKRLVGEVEIGVAWTAGAYAARAGIVRRSNEIRELSQSEGAQNFVRLQFSYAP